MQVSPASRGSWLKKTFLHGATTASLSCLSILAGAILTVNGFDAPPAAIAWAKSEGWLVASLIVFILCSLALVGTSLWQTQLRSALVLLTQSQMASELMPVVNGAYPLTLGNSRGAAKTLKERTLYALRAILALERPRLCLYLHEFTQTRTGVHSSGPAELLVESLEWDDDCRVGRQDAPRKQSFVRGSGPVADSNFRVLDEQRPRLVTDWKKEVKTQGNADLDCEGGGYGGFLVVPVIAGKDVQGILTVDVPHAGVLTDEHVKVAELAGKLLGMALNRMKSSRSRTIPPKPESPGVPKQ